MLNHRSLLAMYTLCIFLIKLSFSKGRISIAPSALEQPSQISNFHYIRSIDDFTSMRSSSDYLVMLFYRTDLESNLIESIQKANKLLRNFLIKINFAIIQLDDLPISTETKFDLTDYDPRFKDLEIGFYFLSRYNQEKITQYMGHIDGKQIVQFIHSNLEEDLGKVELPYLEKLNDYLGFTSSSLLLFVCDSIKNRQKEINAILNNPHFDYILISQDQRIKERYGIRNDYAGVVFRLEEYDQSDDNPKGFYLALDKYELITLDSNHFNVKATLNDLLAIYNNEPFTSLKPNEKDPIPGFPRLLIISKDINHNMSNELQSISYKHRLELSVRTSPYIPEYLNSHVSESELPLYLITVSKKLLLKKPLPTDSTLEISQTVQNFLSDKKRVISEGPSQPLSLLGIKHLTNNIEQELLSHQETILLICSERFVACRKAMVLIQYVKKKILETKINFAYIDPFLNPIEFKTISHLPTIMHLRHPEDFKVDSTKRLFKHQIGIDSDEALNLESVMDLLDSSQYDDRLSPRLLENEYEVYQYFKNFPIQHVPFDLGRRETFEEFDLEELRYFEDLKGKLHEKDKIETPMKEEF